MKKLNKERYNGLLGKLKLRDMKTGKQEMLSKAMIVKRLKIV